MRGRRNKSLVIATEVKTEGNPSKGGGDVQRRRGKKPEGGSVDSKKAEST